MQNYLENICNDIDYDNLSEWNNADINKFSNIKNLYPYQKDTLRNIVKVLHLAFAHDNKTVDEQNLINLYNEYGYDFNTTINSINRMALWMATGSGKTLVLIKTIELIDFLMNNNLIPKKEIALFIPSDDLIRQFKSEINEYNSAHTKNIELVPLKKYEEDKNQIVLPFNTIKVYYCKSGLLTDKRKVNELDYHDYINNGNWYIFLDEAHRGATDSSKFQNYVSELSKNGFQFNFSATFTEDIHYATTCYNFNLERFINAGYGKNIWLSDSMYNFRNVKEDLNEIDKTNQIMKSMIMFAIIKNSKNSDFYHKPLMVTYVNSVNTKDADLKLYFKILSQIASSNDENLTEVFNSIKQELVTEFMNNKKYVFGDEEFNFSTNLLTDLTVDKLRNAIFNSLTAGKIIWQKGEAGKEIVLSLQTAETAFALIRIGDADKFSREMLDGNYEEMLGYERKHYFKSLNSNKSNINLLIGSRTFYEGWDSNRPNIINMINIGSKEAKKFVPQAIGRGVRIQPNAEKPENRKRLPSGDINKNILLETLVIFATDKKSIKSIMDEIEHNKKTSGFFKKLNIKKNLHKFDLLIPKYKDAEKIITGKFAVGDSDYELYKTYLTDTEDSVLFLKHDFDNKQLKFIKQGVNEKNFLFQNDTDKYFSLNRIMRAISNYITNSDKVVECISNIDGEISHFEKIEVNLESIPKSKIQNLTIDEFVSKINKSTDKISKLDKEYKNLIIESQNNPEKLHELVEEILIIKAEINNLKNLDFDTFDQISLQNITNHYFCPLIYSDNEKIEYIKHIIKKDSEVEFVKNLINYIKDKPSDNWMFSKIVENVDDLFMPYFDKTDNRFRKFYPDFIFWIKNEKTYDIYLVDPKGTTIADYQHKVDYYKELFEENGKPKEFQSNKYKVKVHLLLVTDDVNKVGKSYQDYWLNENDFDFLNLL